MYAELYVITFISSCIDNSMLGNELIYLIRVIFFIPFDMRVFRTDKEDFTGNVRVISLALYVAARASWREVATTKRSAGCGLCRSGAALRQWKFASLSTLFLL